MLVGVRMRDIYCLPHQSLHTAFMLLACSVSAATPDVDPDDWSAAVAVAAAGDAGELDQQEQEELYAALPHTTGNNSGRGQRADVQSLPSQHGCGGYQQQHKGDLHLNMWMEVPWVSPVAVIGFCRAADVEVQCRFQWPLAHVLLVCLQRLTSASRSHDIAVEVIDQHASTQKALCLSVPSCFLFDAVVIEQCLVSSGDARLRLVATLKVKQPPGEREVDVEVRGNKRSGQR